MRGFTAASAGSANVKGAMAKRDRANVVHFMARYVWMSRKIVFRFDESFILEWRLRILGGGRQSKDGMSWRAWPSYGQH